MRTYLKFCTLLLPLILGCSSQNLAFDEVKESISKTAYNFWIESPDKTKEALPEPELSVEQNEKSIENNKGNSAVELIWVVPEGRVTKYLLRYGMRHDDLNSIVELPIKKLTEESHPKFGKVYKYILENIPPKTEIYYSLQAGNEFGLSEPTPIASTNSNN